MDDAHIYEATEGYQGEYKYKKDAVTIFNDQQNYEVLYIYHCVINKDRVSIKSYSFALRTQGKL